MFIFEVTYHHAKIFLVLANNFNEAISKAELENEKIVEKNRKDLKNKISKFEDKKLDDFEKAQFTGLNFDLKKLDEKELPRSIKILTGVFIK